MIRHQHRACNSSPSPGPGVRMYVCTVCTVVTACHLTKYDQKLCGLQTKVLVELFLFTHTYLLLAHTAKNNRWATGHFLCISLRWPTEIYQAGRTHSNIQVATETTNFWSNANVFFICFLKCPNTFQLLS